MQVRRSLYAGRAGLHLHRLRQRVARVAVSWASLAAGVTLVVQIGHLTPSLGEGTSWLPWAALRLAGPARDRAAQLCAAGDRFGERCATRAAER